MQTGPEPPNALRTYLPVVLLVLIGMATFANSLHGPFIFDDETWIDKNPYIRNVWPLYHLLQSPPENPLEGRPVNSLIMALNYAVCGRNVVGYHIVNITIHLLAALVLMGIVKRTLQSPLLQKRFGTDATLLSFACALLWMVHPVQTECVCYITQRTESVMGLFYFLTLYCAIRARSASHRWWTISAVAACALGMASKEVMVTAPFMVLLYDLIYRSEPVRKIVRGRWPLYAGLAACWGLLATLMITFPHRGTVGYSPEMTPWQYLKAQSLMIVDYIKTIAWPDVLVLDYGFAMQYSLSEILLPGLIVLGLLLLTIWALFARPQIGYLGAWFFVTLAPTSSFVPILTEVGAERRLYLPLAAVVVLLVISVYLLAEKLTAEQGKRKSAAPSRNPKTIVTTTVILVVAGALCVRTVSRNADYRSGITLMASAVAAHPNNFRAVRNLASELSRAGRLEEARPFFELALELAPEAPYSNYHMGEICYKLGQYAKAERYFLIVTKMDPDFRKVQWYLKETQAKKVVFKSFPAEAEKYRNMAEKFLANNQNAQAAEYFRRAGAVCLNFEESDLAVQMYRRAVSLQKDHFLANYNLASALVDAGDFSSAIEHLKQADLIKPNDLKVQFSLGQVYSHQMRYELAKSAFRRALEINPNFDPARRALAVLESRKFGD